MLQFLYSIYDAHLREHFEVGLIIFGFEESSCCLYFILHVRVRCRRKYKRYVRVSHLLMSFLLISTQYSVLNNDPHSYMYKIDSIDEFELFVFVFVCVNIIHIRVRLASYVPEQHELHQRKLK